MHWALLHCLHRDKLFRVILALYLADFAALSFSNQLKLGSFFMNERSGFLHFLYFKTVFDKKPLKYTYTFQYFKIIVNEKLLALHNQIITYRVFRPL